MSSNPQVPHPRLAAVAGLAARCPRWIGFLSVGVLLLAGCGKEPAAIAAATTDHGKRAHAHTAEILKFGPRPPGSESLGKVLDYVATEMGKSGWVATRQTFEAATPLGQMTFTNLVMNHRSSKGEPPEAVLCAHIDSKRMPDVTFVGADDAASAVGALIEIGRVLAESDPKRAARTEIVFFDGEEGINPQMTASDGIYGSRHYAGEWTDRDVKPRFGILLDMIGHKDLRIRIPSDSPPHLRDALMEAARTRGVLDHYGVAPGPILDDHVPLNEVGIPTIDVIGDFSRAPWWHTPDDNLELIDPQSLETSIQVTLEMLRKLLP